MMRARFQVHVQHGIIGNGPVAKCLEAGGFGVWLTSRAVPSFRKNTLALYEHRAHHGIRCGAASS